MLLPSARASFGVDCRTQTDRAAGTNEVVGHIVFASPLQLHRATESLCDGSCFASIVVHQTTTEATAHSHRMDRDLRFVDLQHVRDVFLGPLRGLTRRPELTTAVGRRTCYTNLRLELRMRNEGILISCLELMRRVGKDLGYLASLRDDSRTVALGKTQRLRTGFSPIVFSRVGLIPLDSQLSACLERRPSRSRHDRNARLQLDDIAIALEDERIDHAGFAFQLLEIRACR